MQAEEAQVVNESSAPIAYVSVPRGEIIRIVITGLLAGLLIPLLTTLLTTYFIDPVFCQAGESDICASGSVIANHISAAYFCRPHMASVLAATSNKARYTAQRVSTTNTATPIITAEI